MIKIDEIKESDGKFKQEQRKKLKDFYLKLTKYDIAIGSASFIALSNLLISPMSQITSPELFIGSGLTGAAFTLAVNGVITGIKSKSLKKEALNSMLEGNKEEESKGKSL